MAIGFVQFFNDEFGFLATRDSKTPELSYLGVYFNDNDLDGSLNADAGDWFSFEIIQNAKGLKAKNLSYADTETALTEALSYWKNPVIDGWNPKHTEHYHKHIISEILKLFFNKFADAKQRFLQILLNFADKCPERETFITVLLEDKEIFPFIDKALFDLPEIIPTSNSFELLKEKFLEIIFKKEINWKIINRLKENGFILKDYYFKLAELVEKNYNKEAESFITNLSVVDIRLILSNLTQSINLDLAIKLHKSLDNKFLGVFVNNENNSDAILFLLFLSGIKNNFTKIDNLDFLLENLEDEYLHKFLDKIIQEDSAEIEIALEYLRAEQLAKILNNLTGATLFDALTNLACKNETLTFEAALLLEKKPEVEDFKNQIWSNVIAELPYIVFDLETDGENIREFAFFEESNLRSYQGEEQLSALLRRLQKSEKIIVGHNIKQWDIPILEKKGLKTEAFIWDTLEIEILLNPKRYAYSLLTSHQAKEDTELTNKLFLNQLYRLAQRVELRLELKDFLPDNLEQLLTKLNSSPYCEFFAKTSLKDKFFKDRLPISKSTEKQLSKLSKSATKKKSLVIAPKTIWKDLALYLPLSFPFLDIKSNPEYRKISLDLIKEKPLSNPLAQAFLLRFCEECATSILLNIPQYLKIVDKKATTKLSFDENCLNNYSISCDGIIDCVDIDIFENSNFLNSYSQIILIGSEYQNRLHKVKISRDMNFEELLQLGGNFPFKISSTNCVSVSKEDFENFFKKLNPQSSFDNDTANMWIERDKKGNFALYKNYFFEDKVQNLVKIDWQYATPLLPPIIAKSAKTDFEVQEVRVNSNSPYRAKYWTVQIALLQKIHELYPELPLVFVIDNLEESEKNSLKDYLTNQGFALRNENDGLKGLDWAFRQNDALLLVDAQKFIKDILSYRTDKAFCVVWDNLAVEKLQIIWKKLPFNLTNSLLGADEKEERSRHTTAAECIEAIWDLFIHYSSMVAANNENSRFYILDPTIETVPNMIRQLGKNKIQYENFPLWKDSNYYEFSYNETREFFADVEVENPSIDSTNAKKLISEMLIDGKGWRPVQEPILDFMLEKKGDCIISMPTGGGKSVLFQGPAIYRGYFSKKLTIVITPLRALMQDQVKGLEEKGFEACVDFLSGDLSFAETRQIYRRILSGDITLLYITPERFRVNSFMKVLKARMELDRGLEYAIFDEAHCIAQWGNDFRPDYINSFKQVALWKENYDIQVALFSATITAQEEDEYKRILPNLEWLGEKREDYNPVRKHINIDFEFIKQHSDDARFENLVELIRKWEIDVEKSKMIVFCRKREDCENFSFWLEEFCENTEDDALNKFSGHIDFYHAGMESLERANVYQRFSYDSSNDETIHILFATKAFGMGMDIPNIHYVAHINPPSVMEDYLQEVGRAGRDEDMYKNAFPVLEGQDKHSLIPAVCLVSNEDFRKLKELLIQSQLSWSHIRQLKEIVLNYMQEFRSLDDLLNNPVVVPWDIWLKDEQKFDETTATKLALFWLEKIGIIKLGFFKPAYLDITLKENNNSNTLTENLVSLNSFFNILYSYVEHKGQRTSLSLQEICKTHHFSLTEFMNKILALQKEDILEINRSVACSISISKYGEVCYAIKYQEFRYLALSIYFKELKTLLENCNLGEEYIFSKEDREKLAEKLNLNCEYNKEELKEITTRDKTGKPKTDIYMPWRKKEDIDLSGQKYVDNLPAKTISKYETFRKKILKNGVSHIFIILAHIPSINFKDNRDKQVFTIKDEQWGDFLTELEKDCLIWLKYVSQMENGEKINWAEKARKLGLLEKGYDYFCSILSILKRLGYILHSPLLPTGVEVYATEKSEEEIDEGIEQNSPYYEFRKEFDELEQLKKIRISCMNLFSKLKNREDKNLYIRQYFQCFDTQSYIKLINDFIEKTNLKSDETDFLKEINDEALKEAENRLNEEQRKIYEQDILTHLNVKAGPGAGKTHILTLRCAKLIYKDKVEPSQILVLAYNRAVVVELRNRLNNLFASLGLGRFAHRISVFTFHGLAKKCLGEKLKDIKTEKWDELLKNFLKNNRGEFRNIFLQIKYILVDEFQDINQNRLDYLMELHDIFPDAKFFTIGDINQSIYGFDRIPANGKELSNEEYANLLNPHKYYESLEELLKPEQKTMFINYRSYQKILDFSARYLPENEEISKSSKYLMEHEPKENYVFEEVISEEDFKNQPWISKIKETIIWAKEENKTNDKNRHIRTIAVFFRTNAEVYKAWSQLHNLNFENVRWRIQGQSICELWRKREIFEMLNYFSSPSLRNRQIILDDNTSKDFLKTIITWGDIKASLNRGIETYKNLWDTYYMEVLESIIHYYIDTISTDEENHTFGELAEFIREITDNDDGGQIYKIYENYHKNDEAISVILTTMHKVKGLEFDVVITVPSLANLPLKISRDDESLTLNPKNLADIEEEKRLMFVACTRAKKRLFVFTGPREQALLENQAYINPALQEEICFEREPNLDKYNLGYATNSYNYSNSFFEELKTLPSHTPIIIKKGYIYTNENLCIGQLAQKSGIKKFMERKNINELKGFFLSDMVAWRFEDTVNSDERNNTNYSSKWCEEAKKKGYIYVPIISGMGEFSVYEENLKF